MSRAAYSWVGFVLATVSTIMSFSFGDIATTAIFAFCMGCFAARADS